MIGPTQENQTAMLTLDDVYGQLKQVYDPEIPVNIVDLGLIYDVQLDQDVCKVRMTLTSQMCPEARTIPEVVKRRLESLSGIRDVAVEIVWDPMWTPQRISPEGRQILGIE
jgi:metal-sulfur cluster biosynthetic enzyme